jgi:putative colanic acid biosynthesis glycosyltransferase
MREVDQRTFSILQINVSGNYGSTGQIAEDIGKKISQSNGVSTIGFGRYATLSASDTIKIGNKFGQAMHLIQTRLFDQHCLGSEAGTIEFVKKIKELNPDIIHLHQLHGYYISMKILFDFLRDFGKPVIWTFHDCWAYTGHCCHYSRVGCEKWKTSCHDCPLTQYYPQSFLYDNSESNYHLKKQLFNSVPNLTLVPVSEWLAGEIKLSFLKGHEIKPIHNGIDIEKYKYSDPKKLIEKYQIDGKSVVLGVASPWSDIKGLRDFVELSKIIDSKIQIILIGLSQIQIKKLPNNIIGISRLDDPTDLAKFYSLADVFVNPSKAESFGLVTVEAMACGTPVVGYNATATPELIKPGTGYVVEKLDIVGLHDRINLILKNGRSSYSDACRENVVLNYNKEVQYDKYLELYKSKLPHFF